MSNITQNFYLDLLYQSFCTQFEIFFETLVGIIVVKIINVENSKAKFLSLLIFNILYPCLYIDKLSRLLNFFFNNFN
jgi:predicted permease